MSAASSRLVCAGCGTQVPDSELLPYRCPRAAAGLDEEHVLRPELDPAALTWPSEASLNPFLRYRRLLHVWHVARVRGLEDAVYVELVEELDARIAAVDGEGFRATPMEQHEGLGLDEAVLVKDETRNVAGSHKGRHLMGLLLHLEVLQRTGGIDAAELHERRLAIASCGNAALAAAVLARAANLPLDVFVPPDAPPAITSRLSELGAMLHIRPREEDVPGDPCWLAFLRAVERGALPFCCQGPANGLNGDGGRTLAFELVDQWGTLDHPVDHLLVQVGGGALAAACLQGLALAETLGAMPLGIPRVHAVQTEGAAPLARAWELVLDDLLRKLPPGERELLPPRDYLDGLAGHVRDLAPGELVNATLALAARQRSRYMRPWERTPQSLAAAILDDETYDWLEVVRGLLRTGGLPLVVREPEIENAWHLATEVTTIPACPTATAGLAAARQARADGLLAPTGPGTTLLFTGARR